MSVTTKTRGIAMRGVSAAVALAVFGTSSLAFAQAKPAKPATAAPAKAAPAAKAPAATKPAAAGAAKTPATKAPDKKAAGAAFKKGKDAFEKKDYKTAKEEFMKAEEILPAGTAEYYIGRCQEELGDPADAVKWYEKAQADTKLKEDLSKDAKTRADALKAKPAKVHVTSDPPGATIMVDGKAVPEKTPADIELAPGTHKITLQSAGKKDSEQSVEVAAFTGGTVNATLEAAAPPPVPAEDPFAGKKAPETPPPATTTTTTSTTTTTITPEKRDMTWVWITGGAAIVALGVGTVFGIQALSKKKDFDDASAGGANPNKAAAEDARDAGTRNALISDMGFGIGITLAVTSAVLYFTRPTTDEAKPAAASKKSGTTMSFAPVATPQGGGAFFKVAF
jgi:hypothetical protein